MGKLFDRIDVLPNWAKNFIIGGASGIAATCVIHPVDLIKVRI